MCLMLMLGSQKWNGRLKKPDNYHAAYREPGPILRAPPMKVASLGAFKDHPEPPRAVPFSEFPPPPGHRVRVLAPGTPYNWDRNHRDIIVDEGYQEYTRHLPVIPDIPSSTRRAFSSSPPIDRGFLNRWDPVAYQTDDYRPLCRDNRGVSLVQGHRNGIDRTLIQDILDEAFPSSIADSALQLSTQFGNQPPVLRSPVRRNYFDPGTNESPQPLPVLPAPNYSPDHKLRKRWLDRVPSRGVHLVP